MPHHEEGTTLWLSQPVGQANPRRDSRPRTWVRRCGTISHSQFGMARRGEARSPLAVIVFNNLEDWQADKLVRIRDQGARVGI